MEVTNQFTSRCATSSRIWRAGQSGPTLEDEASLNGGGGEKAYPPIEVPLMRRVAVSCLLAILGIAADVCAQSPNLALGKSVSRSSACSCGLAERAVDGSVETYWQPLSGDRADLNVWLTVDLGAPSVVDRAVLNFRTKAGLAAFAVQTSNDGANWQEAYRSSGTVDTIHTALFSAPITARYVRADFTL